MKCSEFQKLSTQTAELTGDAQLREQWELHLLACASCAETFTASELLTSSEAGRFTESVMAKTVTRRDELDLQLSKLRESKAPPELLAGVLRQTVGAQNTQSVRSKQTSRHWAFFQSPGGFVRVDLLLGVGIRHSDRIGNQHSECRRTTARTPGSLATQDRGVSTRHGCIA